MINNEMIEFIEFLEKLGYRCTYDLEHNKRTIIKKLKLDYLLSIGGLMEINGSGKINIWARSRTYVLSALEDHEILDISVIYPEAVSLFISFSEFDSRLEKEDRTEIIDKFKELKDRVVHREVDIQW